MNATTVRQAARVVAGSAMIFAGIGHWTFAREGFQDQVPEFVTNYLPVDEDAVVLASGVVEIGLGAALVATPPQHRRLIGALLATFFVAIFPGNLAQYVHHRPGLGLDTDRKRFVRLWFQPAMVAVAWWSTHGPDAD